EPLDPERSFYYPLYLDLDLERGPWDDDDFDIDEGTGLGGARDGGGGAPNPSHPHFPPPTVEEGPIFALCMAGAGDRRTLGKWLSGLQEENPVLGKTPVIFRLNEGGVPGAGPPLAQLEPP
ncbi:ECSIT protein, partial [Probosciger aterrimus]|nr:ECSIT protein [Probosciger aterrimus]